jgi:hypothetical protein
MTNDFLERTFDLDAARIRIAALAAENALLHDAESITPETLRAKLAGIYARIEALELIVGKGL